MNYNELTELRNCLNTVDQYFRLHSSGTPELWQRIDDNISMLDMVIEDYKNDPENNEEFIDMLPKKPVMPEMQAMEEIADKLFEEGFALAKKLRAA